VQLLLPNPPCSLNRLIFFFLRQELFPSLPCGVYHRLDSCLCDAGAQQETFCGPFLGLLLCRLFVVMGFFQSLKPEMCPHYPVLRRVLIRLSGSFKTVRPNRRAYPNPPQSSVPLLLVCATPSVFVAHFFAPAVGGSFKSHRKNVVLCGPPKNSQFFLTFHGRSVAPRTRVSLSPLRTP